MPLERLEDYPAFRARSKRESLVGYRLFDASGELVGTVGVLLYDPKQSTLHYVLADIDGESVQLPLDMLEIDEAECSVLARGMSREQLLALGRSETVPRPSGHTAGPIARLEAWLKEVRQGGPQPMTFASAEPTAAELPPRTHPAFRVAPEDLGRTAGALPRSMDQEPSADTLNRENLRFTAPLHAEAAPASDANQRLASPEAERWDEMVRHDRTFIGAPGGPIARPLTPGTPEGAIDPELERSDLVFGSRMPEDRQLAERELEDLRDPSKRTWEHPET